MNKLGVAIIGCGVVGKKRAQSLPNDVTLLACVDKDIHKAQAIAQKNTKIDENWQKILQDPSVQMVIVATSLDVSATIMLECVKAGKHVLVEKPAARHSTELMPILNILSQNKSYVRVGFNHRYHPALLKAQDIVRSGELGELMFICGRYGHGGRLGYEKEWRSDPTLSGGGQLIDQGVHLIDLSRMLLGDFVDIEGIAKTYFWDRPVEDNGFMLLKTAKQQVAFLQVSCTAWKNIFCFEIYGKNGKLQIDGLGGSYGVERLTHYKMRPEMGPPDTIIWEYPQADQSWQVEFLEFLEDIKKNRQPAANLFDAYAALTIVEKICKESGYDHCT